MKIVSVCIVICVIAACFSIARSLKCLDCGAIEGIDEICTDSVDCPSEVDGQGSEKHPPNVCMIQLLAKTTAKMCYWVKDDDVDRCKKIGGEIVQCFCKTDTCNAGSISMDGKEPKIRYQRCHVCKSENGENCVGKSEECRNEILFEVGQFKGVHSPNGCVTIRYHENSRKLAKNCAWIPRKVRLGCDKGIIDDVYVEMCLCKGDDCNGGKKLMRSVIVLSFCCLFHLLKSFVFM